MASTLSLLFQNSLLVLILSCLVIVHNCGAQEEIISTPLGQLKGQILTARGGHRYNAFVGIPFAEKTERFEVAQPVEPWEGIRDALNYSSMCPQVVNYAGMEFVIGIEDCLYINVFYPHSERCLNDNGEPMTQLPVLVFIYGGAYTSGYGDMYSPTFLMSQCITYVSFNYRLGALGFLTTNDGLIPGNLGLKDQHLALKWVQNNIASFRGDPQKVTISGQSAGASSVEHHIMSPTGNGLFSQAIAQSGSVINKFGLIPNPHQNAVTLGHILNCTFESTAQLKECLLSIPFDVIVRLQEKGKTWYNDPMLWGPVIELSTADKPFQTRDPYTLLKNGEFNRVPLITGVVLEEGILVRAGEILLNPLALNDLNTNWNKFAPITFSYNELNLTKEVKDEISDQIRQFYLGNRTIENGTRDELSHLYSDRYFNYAISNMAQLYSKYAPVYHYNFVYKGLFTFTMMTLGYTDIVVSHSDENPYLFDIPTVPGHATGSEQEMMSQNLVNLWASFVQNGEPTGTWTPGIQWSANENTGNSSLVTLRMDTEMEILTDYLDYRMKFWDELYQLTSVEYP